MTQFPVSPEPLSDACHLFDERLMAYLDTTMTADERASMDAHRTECARCNALVREIEALKVSARALPPMAPSRDLWSGIEARLESTVVAPLSERTFAPSSLEATFTPRRMLSVRTMAIAASALIAVTAGITWRIARTGADATAATRLAIAPTTDSTPVADSTSGTAVRVGNVDAVYESEIVMLRSIVNTRMTELDSSTVREIQRNLAIIDKAIADSRAALAHDPNNQASSGALDRALLVKLTLLRRVALL